MDEKTSQNRVVITDEMGEVVRIKSDAEIVKENQELEDAMRPKTPAAPPPPSALDLDVLAKLKMMQKAKEEVPMEIEPLKDRSLNFGVVGLGHGGSRLAETFAEFGYEACAFNTASQDLEYIKLPTNRKTLLPFALGGAGKELDNGRQAVEQNAELILAKLNEVFGEDKQDVFLVATSGGGGTGSGGVCSLIELLSTLGKPVGVIFILPAQEEDSQSKHNSIVTLSKLAKMANEKIAPLIIVDNSKIEQIYPGLSEAEFWSVANHAIVEPLHLFNHLSALPTRHTALDPMDLSRILLTGNVSIYGMIEVNDFEDVSSLASSVIDNLENGLLASGFNLKETMSMGFIVAGNQNSLNRLQAVCINYASHMLSEICNSPVLSHGVYEIDIPDDTIRIYSLLSGLGLPSSRIVNLQKEAEVQMAIAKEKEKTKAEKMVIDYGDTASGTQAAEIHRLISQKKTAFGKLTANAGKKVIDHRKR